MLVAPHRQRPKLGRSVNRNAALALKEPLARRRLIRNHPPRRHREIIPHTRIRRRREAFRIDVTPPEGDSKLPHPIRIEMQANSIAGRISAVGGLRDSIENGETFVRRSRESHGFVQETMS